MNFQGLKKIEDDRFYIDLAFRRANERASDVRGTKKMKGTRLEKSKRIEVMRIDVIKDVLSERLIGILKSFPDIESLPEFYKELIKCTVDYASLKKSLGALNWARKKVLEMHKKYSAKIRKCMELSKINTFRREFYGRVSSVLSQIKTNLKTIENARKSMKNYPAIKTGVTTIAIAGFPNVGKTTLLFKLTGSKPDIQPYAFTTKGINVGYIKKAGKKIQFLDTPGTLDRFEKMNNIEKVAFLALKMLAEKIIYVFDLTEPYPLEDQIRLFNKIKAMKKNVIPYLSKTDIIDKKIIEEFLKKYKIKAIKGQLQNIL